MKTIQYIIIFTISTLLISCVSSKKFKRKSTELTQLEGKYKDLEALLAECNKERTSLRLVKGDLESERTNLNTRITDLLAQIEYLKNNNNRALKSLEDLSVITSTQAESIKKSMDNIGAKDNYIQTLQQQLAHKDSLNMALVMNLKGAIGKDDNDDIEIKVEKGVVFIDISDKLLFKSGSYNITDRASAVLGKVAKVLKNQPEIEFMVEGHTDNVDFKSGDLLDNWDLSVKRATSVVRILQNKYGLDPSKIAAAGRSEYKPLLSNTSIAGRAANRRTRIVILPQLDQFYKLLEPKKN